MSVHDVTVQDDTKKSTLTPANNGGGPPLFPRLVKCVCNNYRDLLLPASVILASWMLCHKMENIRCEARDAANNAVLVNQSGRAGDFYLGVLGKVHEVDSCNENIRRRDVVVLERKSADKK